MLSELFPAPPQAACIDYKDDGDYDDVDDDIYHHIRILMIYITMSMIMILMSKQFPAPQG